MTPRRLAAAALATALAAGVGAAQIAHADPAVDPGTVDDVTAPAEALQLPLDGLGEVDLYSIGQRYWACLAVDGVDFGLCLDNPLPDTSQLPTVPELLGQLGG